MGLYNRYILPHVVNLACSQKPTMRQREKVVPRAKGRVLEIGFGSGLNIPYYDPSSIDRLWALEPSEDMWRLAERTLASAPMDVECLLAGAEEIPLPRNSIDSVLLTYSLCTIPEPERALREIRRVLSGDGRLIFCEHGEAPDASVRNWQRRLNPAWKYFGGGCHLDRPIPALIQSAGFRIDGLETMYLPGWKPASFNYWGEAHT